MVRHGDRTPKQKIKAKITQPALLALFDKYRNAKGHEAKLKNPIQLQEVRWRPLALRARLPPTPLRCSSFS